MDLMIPLRKKNTLADYMILSGADNRPPMLDKDLYDSWKSRMELYMQNKEHIRMILESVENGPLIWPTIEESGVTKTKKYVKLSAAEKIQADCDMKATNIILQGLPADIYSLVNHHRVAKDLWEGVQLLMQGTSLTKQERECKLYDAFDKFTHINRESLHNLPPEWSKFVTDVKLVKDLHTTNFDQLHAYLEQHELHANELPLVDSSFDVPIFSSGDDLIACLKKAMAFLMVVASSRFPSTNNQLRTSSNLRNHATIQDGRVIVKQVQGRQGQSYYGTSYKSNATRSEGNNDKAMLAEAQEAGQILDEEQLAFLIDPGVPNGQVVKKIIPNNAAFQTQDLDTYDSNCDDISNAKVVLMANISNYGLDVILERQRLRAGYGTVACALGKSKKSSHQPKAEDTNQEKLYLLHMDLCGPMRVASINGKRYILVIVDEYSRFTWVKFLRSKDEAPEAIIKCIKNIQVHLNATVRNVRTDNGTEFINQTLHEFYKNVGISHQTSVACTPQ
ncbi:retrovirus-related pol polyprotein from transposon TNT 1-94 [Tanacetum coccineum]